MTPIRFAYINTNNAFVFARTGFATDLTDDFIDVPANDLLFIGTEGNAISIRSGNGIRILFESGGGPGLRGFVEEVENLIGAKDTSRDSIDYLLTVAAHGFKLLESARKGF